MGREVLHIAPFTPTEFILLPEYSGMCMIRGENKSIRPVCCTEDFPDCYNCQEAIGDLTAIKRLLEENGKKVKINYFRRPSSIYLYSKGVVISACGDRQGLVRLEKKQNFKEISVR